MGLQGWRGGEARLPKHRDWAVGEFSLSGSLGRGPGRASDKGFQELCQAGVLAELFLQSHVLQGGHLLVSESEGGRGGEG